jgi:hypothetical protein
MSNGLGDSFRFPELPTHAFRGVSQLGEAEARARTSTNVMADLAKANMANEFYARLVYAIQAFDKSLDQDEEVGMRLVTFGQAITFHVESLGYHDPSIIYFHGTTDNGDRVSLVQHVSQISFLLIAMKRKNPDEPKKPFGFDAGRKGEQECEQPETEPS